MQLPTHDQLYAFLKAHYKTDRFEGRAGAWCPDYPHVVTRSTMEALSERGYSCVSQYEHASGKGFYFDASLAILDHGTAMKYLRGDLPVAA